MAASPLPVDAPYQLISIFSCLFSKSNYLIVTDLPEVFQLLKRHHYSGITYYTLGIYLGLSYDTLYGIANNNKGDIDGGLCECLTKWLQKADDVKKKGGPTIYSLVSALRKLKKKRIADGIDMESKFNKNEYCIL